MLLTETKNDVLWPHLIADILKGACNLRRV